MQLSNIETLYKNAEEKQQHITLHLLNSKGVVTFPLKFNFGIQMGAEGSFMSDFSLYFELLIDVEHLYTFTFSYLKRTNYTTELSPKLLMNCEPFYEYGNEEEYLPKISSYSYSWTEEETIGNIEDNVKNFFNENTSLKKLVDSDDILSTFKEFWNMQKTIAYDPKYVDGFEGDGTQFPPYNSYDLENLRYLFDCFERYKNTPKKLTL